MWFRSYHYHFSFLSSTSTPFPLLLWFPFQLLITPNFYFFCHVPLFPTRHQEVLKISYLYSYSPLYGLHLVRTCSWKKIVQYSSWICLQYRMSMNRLCQSTCNSIQSYERLNMRLCEDTILSESSSEFLNLWLKLSYRFFFKRIFFSVRYYKRKKDNDFYNKEKYWITILVYTDFFFCIGVSFSYI